MRIGIQGFDKIKSGVEPVPAGTYDVICEGGEEKTNKEGTGKCINWTFSILNEEFIGKKLFDMTSLKETALWKLKGLLNALEAPQDEEGFATEDAVGLKCKVVVDVESYEGQERNKIKNHLPL